MKKFVNFRFVVTLVLAIFANVATYAQDNVVDEVVWVVGDEAILKSDVEEARMDALYNGQHHADELRDDRCRCSSPYSPVKLEDENGRASWSAICRLISER